MFQGEQDPTTPSLAEVCLRQTTAKQKGLAAPVKVITRILAPTDLTEMSGVGVKYALELASAVYAEVVVLNVAPYDEEFPYPLGIGEVASSYIPSQSFEETLRTHREMLERYLKDHFAAEMEGLNVSFEVDIGDADEVILEKAQDASVDLIVMATHGRTGIEHVLVGSVTENVIRKARCPVLSLRQPDPAMDAPAQ